MPDYAWRAANASGQISSGVLSAASQSQAMQQLRARGLHPLALTPASGEELALARGQAAVLYLPSPDELGDIVLGSGTICGTA